MLTEKIQNIDNVMVRDVETPSTRMVFVRLVPPNVMLPDNTISTEAHVDVDTEGNVIGVTLFMGDV